jgi:putative Mg2+ transporter-C (MgtC) family protein
MKNLLTDSVLMSYWSAPEVAVNLLVFMNIVGALLLGLVVGYERTYHGRAAGMRTYGLVCMASAALTVLAGYPGYWYAGHALEGANPDPTRIIQGIVTGIGFLGAGMIMKEGFSISGLTSAASLWASSAIGILVGIGFYTASILLTAASVACMMWVSHVERWLPSHRALAMTLRFKDGVAPDRAALERLIFERGYRLAPATLTVSYSDSRAEWRFVAFQRAHNKAESVDRMAADLAALEGVESFQLSHARN